MTAAWTVRDNNGHLLADFVCPSRLEVGRKVAPAHYDAFRLQVSSSYRELFDRAVRQALERRGWEIVRVGERKRTTGRSHCLDDHPIAAHQ
jgi:hypothetical protein